MTGQGIGASLIRKEDDRYMRGRGSFVGDIRPAGMLEVAFLRGGFAHARLKAIKIPAEIRARVFIAEDLVGVAPIRADTALAGFKSSIQPILATGKVRHVGELVAMCVAPTRAEAEDLAALVEVDYEELPAVHDMLEGRKAEAPLVHEHWADNLYLSTEIDADFEAAKAKAKRSVTRELRTARQVMSPLEGRGVIAEWNGRLGQLVVTSSTQQSHIVRTGLAECLGVDEGQVRVIAPDVGGGFGYKGILLAEEVALSWGARKLGRPLRWLEDRRENLTAGADCREHHYVLTAYADENGRLLALDCEASVDCGRLFGLSVLGLSRSRRRSAAFFPGLYDSPLPVPHLLGGDEQRPPILPYRGVARTGVCFALEVTLDAWRGNCGREPERASLQEPGAPGADAVRQHRQAVISTAATIPKRCGDASPPVDLSAVRERQKRGEADGRLIGLGIAMYLRAGRATAPGGLAGWGIPMVPGFEQCHCAAHARWRPGTSRRLRQPWSRARDHALAEWRTRILGVPHELIRLVHGDTAETPYSTGTWGSRA